MNKFKIPTLLGLSIIMIGIITGVILTLKEQIFISQASPNAKAQNITLSNISETEITISWQTSTPATSFITFGAESPNETTVLDDRDTNPAPDGAGPKAHSIHYVTIKNLLPKTSYQYKIISGKTSSEILKFTTATPLSEQTGFRPIIGSVLDGDKPLDTGIVYLSIPEATTQSALIKSSGNYLIPISQIRKSDLSDSYPLSEETVVKLTVISDKDSASALFKLIISNNPLPSLYLGQNIDLTTQELSIYDLNGDGKINAADNAIVLQNFGPVPDGTGLSGTDLNRDGVVDQKDLDLMAKQINQ